MKKIATFMILTVLAVNSALASTCIEAHQERAVKKAEKVWHGEHVDFYYSMSNHGAKSVGGFWLALGIGFAPTLAASFPLVIGGTIVAGGAVLTKSIIDSVQEPRYAMINQMIRKSQGLPAVEINDSKLFKKVLRKAQDINSDVTADQLENLFVSGMQSGEFCVDEKPFTYKQMEKAVLSSLNS